MGSKERLCVICGRFIADDDGPRGLVPVIPEGGNAHKDCEKNTQKPEECISGVGCIYADDDPECAEECGARVKRDREKVTCTYDPRPLKGLPIGMFHCPNCGEMQIAGEEHLPPDEPSAWP